MTGSVLFKVLVIVTVAIAVSFHHVMPKDTAKDYFVKTDTSIVPTPCTDIACYTVYPTRYLQGHSEYYSMYQHKTKGRKGKRLLATRMLVYESLTSSNQIVYFHIHKNGGTTMRSSAKEIPGYQRETFYMHDEREMGHEKYAHELARVREHWSDDSFLFSFMRDPVKRFVSGVTQIENNKSFGDCFPECKRGADDLDCVLGILEDSGSFINPHLLPQLFELYHNLGGSDFGVVVTDLANMGSFMSGLGISQLTNARGRGNATKSTSTVSPTQIRRICKLYKMDVDFLRSMSGYIKSPCLGSV
jgi:hypothetical protein